MRPARCCGSWSARSGCRRKRSGRCRSSACGISLRTRASTCRTIDGCSASTASRRAISRARRTCSGCPCSRRPTSAPTPRRSSRRMRPASCDRTPAVPPANRWCSGSAASASPTTWPPSGAPPAGGASTSVIPRSCSGGRRSNSARRTACARCAIACSARCCCQPLRCRRKRSVAFIEAIRRRRPRMLFGYPSAIDHVAAAAERDGIPLNDLGARVAFVTGERLYDEQRERIERVFGCPVANGYGGRDAGFVAHQCPAGSLHVTAEDVIVELVDSQGSPVAAGEPGEIVVTHLASRDYPFIRYRTGDIATTSATPCRCGRGLPVLTEVHGRSTDFVVAQDGTVMHGLALIYVLRELPDIQAFRIVQERLDVTRVEVVCDGELAEATAASIRDGFRRRLGEGVTVEVEPVPEIAAERSGKYRYVVSNVDPEVRREGAA
ncbi:MAG: AMP-binding protein [Halofilum sp. (in: g-proteobacteria)]|nr:AMP-binding protein [Halofilum sp. (in: g-proteobacteria)]